MEYRNLIIASFGIYVLFLHSVVMGDCVKQDVSRLKWAFAPSDVLKEHLYEDELCLISAISSNITSPTEGHKSLVGGCSDQSVEQTWNQLVMSRSSPGCTIAGTYYRCLSRREGRFKHDPNSCGATIQDRYSFFASHFEHLAPSCEGVSVPHALSLYNTIRRLNYSNVLEQGDSISFQIYMALQGTWERSRTRSDYRGPFQMYRGHFMSCGLKKVSRSSKDPRECFTSDNSKCTDDNQAMFMKNYTARVILERQPPGQSTAGYRSLVLFHPFGVHIWDEDLGVVNGVARGIIAAGKEALQRNSTLLVLESPAQHFVYDIGRNGEPIPASDNRSGLYQQNNKFFRTKVSGPCCQKTNANSQGNFRNIALLAALDKADPEWRNYVGWIHIYHITQQVENGHKEADVDCTHFSYNPFFFDPLWQEMEYEIVRLQQKQ